jgi:hypothetical protein
MGEAYGFDVVQSPCKAGCKVQDPFEYDTTKRIDLCSGIRIANEYTSLFTTVPRRYYELAMETPGCGIADTIICPEDAPFWTTNTFLYQMLASQGVQSLFSTNLILEPLIRLGCRLKSNVTIG